MDERDGLLDSVRYPDSHFSQYLDQMRVPRFEQLPVEYTIHFAGFDFTVGEIKAKRAEDVQQA